MEKNNDIWLMNLQFGKAYKQAKESGVGDCQLFVNVCEKLVKTIREIETIDTSNPMIFLALSKMVREEMEEIKQLKESLEKREMIAG